MRGHSLALLAIKGDQNGIALLGQSYVHGVAASNLILGRNFGSQVSKSVFDGDEYELGYPAQSICGVDHHVKLHPRRYLPPRAAEPTAAGA